MRRLSVLAALCGCGTGFAPDRAPNAFFRGSTRTPCEVSAFLGFVNEPSTTAEVLISLGVPSEAAANLITARAGEDLVEGTDDDVTFTEIAQVDAISSVDHRTIDAIYTYNSRYCDVVPDPEFACMERTLIEWLSSSDTTEADLIDLGVPGLAASELIAHRNGLDGAPATDDDQRFHGLRDVEGVRHVDGQTMADLLAWSLGQCQRSAEVIFSPVPYEQSHLVRVVEAMDHARRSIDIAMYSFSDASIMDAIARAKSRGVQVRMLYQSASEHRRDPEGTRSAQLEELGVEVRWVNKTMHHKFALIDGPQNNAAEAGRSVLISGSGNWSNSAATRYDENTLVLHGDARLNLQFQREFNHLWANGRPVLWNESIPPVQTLPIEPPMLAGSEGAEAWFTSGNFEAYQHSTYGPTFRTEDRSVVRDAMVQLIDQADESVWIASGHLRSRPIFNALVRKRIEAPHIDIRVYLDGQEFVSDGYYEEEWLEHETCMILAEDADDFQDCLDKGYYFGAALYRAGVPVRYKMYAYRWNYAYANQMHHKYVIVDGDIVATGSYNLSPNAEFETFENVIVLHKAQYREVVAGFVNNFETLWETRREDGLASFWGLVEHVGTPGNEIPLVWPAMALSHEETAFLKDTIVAHCPQVESEEYRSNPGDHLICE